MDKIAQAQRVAPCLPSTSFAHCSCSQPLRDIAAVKKYRIHSAILFAVRPILTPSLLLSLPRSPVSTINRKSAWSSPRHWATKKGPSGKGSGPGAGRGAGCKRRRRMEALSSHPRFLPWMSRLQCPRTRQKGMPEISTGGKKVDCRVGGVIGRQIGEEKKRPDFGARELTGCP